MAAERRTGLAALPTGLLRPTRPPEASIPAGPTIEGDDEAAEPAEPAESAENQGRGEPAAESKAPARARRRRQPVSTKTTGRKLHLPDDVHDRLWLLARQRRQSVSTVAAEILDRNLPRYRIEREG